MDCPFCSAVYPRNDRQCPTCGRLNGLWVVKWCGLVLAPAVYLCLLYLLGRYQSTHWYLSGFPWKYLNGGWIYVCFPFAGIPFVWLGGESGIGKIGLSVAYVSFYYGSIVLAWVLMFLILEWFH